MISIKPAILVAGIALLASAGGASAQARYGTDVDVRIDVDRGDRVRTERRIVRERRDLSVTGSVERRGASRPGFCPPGQAKKPGRGSAHNC